MTTRTLVLSTPHWPLTAAGVPPTVPAVVVHANRVVASSPAARAEGVVDGLRRRESQARCPTLEVLEYDPDRDARRFEPVVAALEDLTPRVEVLEPGRCSFPTRGPSRYFGGDKSLTELVADRADAALGELLDMDLCPMPLACRIGVADGLFAAGLAADAQLIGERFHIIEPDTSSSFLAPLSVVALQRWCAPLADGESLVDLLWRLGLRSLGRVAEVPASDLLARFGPDGLLAHRLASGLDERPPDTKPVPPESHVESELDPPAMRVDTATFVAKALADQMHSRLAADGLACTRLIIEAETEHGEHLSRVWRHEGALSPSDVADRVRWQLDGWLSSRHRPTAGISVLRLVPDEVIPDSGRQLGFWGGQTQAAERAERALARVQGLLGASSVTIPERRGARGPVEQVGKVPLPLVDLTGDRSGCSPCADAPWPGNIPAPSPSVFHREPFPVYVVSAGRPIGVTGRGELTSQPDEVCFGGDCTAIINWAGPWLVDERWWEPGQHRRVARLQVVLADETAHVLILESGEWRIEATYD